MRDFNIWCPTCNKEFQGEIWESGSCPFCGRKYWFDEVYNEEYDDCFMQIDWGWTEVVNNTKASG
jgi:hypothetical protein